MHSPPKAFHLVTLAFFFLMIRRPPRSTPFPTRRSSDLVHMAAWKRTFDAFLRARDPRAPEFTQDRKSTRLNSSHTDNLVCRLLLEKRSSDNSCVHSCSFSSPGLTPHRADHGPFGSFMLEQYLFFNDTATTEIYTLSLHDALPI